MPENDPCDLKQALENVGGFEDILVDAAKEFLKECPQLLSDIQAARSAGDQDRLSRAAHTLKSSVAIFAADDATAAARQMEELGREGEFAKFEDAWPQLQLEMDRVMQALTQFVSQANSD